jgi:hypothetical protein
MRIAGASISHVDPTVLRDRERRRLAVIAAGCRSTSVANSHLPSNVDGSH